MKRRYEKPALAKAGTLSKMAALDETFSPAED